MGLLGGSESVVDPAARDKYLLQGATNNPHPKPSLTTAVTAGPTYDPTTHTQVSVNSAQVHKIDNNLATTYLRVRIKDYHGLPRDAPETCPYFTHPQHTSDRYSVAWSFVPKRAISGAELIMGFDFSHPVRDRLPPGTKTAVKIATTILDPGLYADPYSDGPYLYGPALSSFFAFRVGGTLAEESAEAQVQQLERESGGVVEEGAALSGEGVRAQLSIPGSWKARRKFFLDEAQLARFVFEEGRVYHADFFNPHLDFSNFSLRLPGFSISVAKYVDEKTHHLRFVLKSRESGEVLFVVFFKLLFGQELDDTLASLEPRPNVTASQTDGSDTEIINQALNPDPPRQQPTEREIPRGTQARPFREPPGFAPPKPFVRDAPSDYILNAAANTLAQSVAAAFNALGFGRASDADAGSGRSGDISSSRSDTKPVDSRSDTEPTDSISNAKSPNSSPITHPPTTPSDTTIENHLRDRHSNSTQ